jgi:hypothetical protein
MGILGKNLQSQALVCDFGGGSIRHWLGPIGRSCRSGDGLLIGPAPSQSELVQSLPQLRSKLLDALGVRPTRSAFASLRVGGEELKKRFPMLQIRIYDAQTHARDEIRIP